MQQLQTKSSSSSIIDDHHSLSSSSTMIFRDSPDKYSKNKIDSQKNQPQSKQESIVMSNTKNAHKDFMALTIMNQLLNIEKNMKKFKQDQENLYDNLDNMIKKIVKIDDLKIEQEKIRIMNVELIEEMKEYCDDNINKISNNDTHTKFII